MCLRQTAALVGPVGLTTLQKEAVIVRYITEGMIEKLYRVLVDVGDMTSLQRAYGQLNNTWSAKFTPQGNV